ncbi:phytoene/squalene synthase family protein [Streptomyces noursei]|uniref:phytoene/squalene synthase family protein n=1 Tax=Streptomyces noursei TaxID=1971 RepID=UPI001675A409|nr:phytoene/squalene synthase family protein [Streptomyces noursei]MCZ1019887.1 phytoene/squalene synthase family protein [Streptomyces noursei]GGX34076.1 phytoene synthase [Streptomyces noursei]
MYLDHRALTRAGIHDPVLRESYEYCRRLLVAIGDGKDIWRGSLLLPPERRPHMWAVYGFVRHYDELSEFPVDTGEGQRRFADWCNAAMADLESGHSCEPSVRALRHTLRTWDLDPARVRGLLDGFLMDQSVPEYATFDDLLRYMRLIAVESFHMVVAVMGPAIRPAGPQTEAMALALQLTNLIRDVAEDQRRGRTYLPLEDLDRFGVTRQDLARGRMTPAIRDLVKFEVGRAHALYERGAGLPDLLHPQCRELFRASLTFYRSYLTEIERRDYNVLSSKPRIGPADQARMALRLGVPLLMSRARRSGTGAGPARRWEGAACS